MFTELKNLRLPISFTSFQSLKILKIKTRGENQFHYDLEALSLIENLNAFRIYDVFIDTKIKNLLVIKGFNNQEKEDFEIFFSNHLRALTFYKYLLKGHVTLVFDPDSGIEYSKKNLGLLKDEPNFEMKNTKKENYFFFCFNENGFFINVKKFLDCN